MTGDSRQPGSASLGKSLAVGFWVGLCGAVVLACGEFFVRFATTSEFTWEGAKPLDLRLAVVGMQIATQGLLWIPILVVGAGLHHATVGRRWGTSPLPFLVALWVALAGVSQLPAMLQQMQHLVRVGSVVAALCVYALLRWRGTGWRRVGLMACGACAAAALLSVTAFVRSPWLDPGSYRVASPAAERPRPARPHVLLIVLDTVRADRMSVHGYDRPTTPFLADWATQAIVFDHAIADGTWTLPSHASMFTGASVRSHGVGRVRSSLDDSLPTTAEVLSQNGYATASFSNNALISRPTNLDRGFSVSRVILEMQRGTRSALSRLLERRGRPPLVPWLDRDYGAALTNHLIAGWLDGEAPRDAPLFLFVNYLEAHLPWPVPASHRRLFADDEQVRRSYELRRRAYGDIDRVLNWTVLEKGPHMLAPADREVLKRQYEAAIHYLDDRVRELIELFEARGMLRDTLVIIASDHGEYLDDHGMWSHLFGTYNDLTRVALIVREPGRQTPKRVTTPVQLSDIHPTVLGVALDARTADSPYGPRNLLDVAARGGEPRIALSEAGEIRAGMMRYGNQTGTGGHGEPEVTAQDGRFKLVVPQQGRPRLYDLRMDPEERVEAPRSRRREAARLRQHIEAWQEAVPPAATESVDIDPLLRALGYVE